MKKEFEGLPVATLRRSLENKAPGCVQAGSRDPG